MSEIPRKPRGDSGGTRSRAHPSHASPKDQAKGRVDRLPPYKLLLHNDDVNDMAYVVQTIQELTALSREEATQRMLEAHKNGVALLLVTHKERAELYAEQFASKGLTVTIEPA
ncbi:MAG: ATP-dependent Clp protease adaptor ClpS [Gemmatales bacterium]|nr:ATP-dependent Clp protease adaptor ClpS [Gemmatales bacterium]MCS7160349.1 ATP-dependent Clp protease adaptor ClpS [Gemmatales bacterium]MDW8175549.1 ATP-dependent Clp protease adaptor ClpS [Gemmatales bacterium]MDW8222002.1 ATP-dependent Clp protease adaptor ClpS [Gemmatales bacterium]